MAQEYTNPNGIPRRPRKSEMKKKRRRSSGAKAAAAFLYVILVIGAAAVLATVGWTWANDLLALNKEYSSTIITIPPSYVTQFEESTEEGETYKVSSADIDLITDQLAREGLINHKFLFRLYAAFSNADRKIVAGTYELNTEMDYRALVVNMGPSSATRQTVDVTVPEGYTLDQIFQLLESQGVSTVEQLKDMAANWPYKWSFLQDLPLGDYRRLEGYLFPDTYTFYLGEDPKYILNKMLLRFDQQLGEYYDQFTEESPYSLHDVVIIASLIEEETNGEDYGRIASVIYNRLNNPAAETAGYLQMDSTLVYINGGRKPNANDKQLPSPYNTYLYKGLPAGPITNPGMASLYAALDPEKTGYFYYVYNPATGEHEFSRTYDEHMNRVSKINNQ